MRQSDFYLKPHKEFPADEESINAKYLIRAGFVEKISSGVYAYLPLGLRVLNKIISIIHEELNQIGAKELLMPALIGKKYWEATDRWDADIMYRLKDSSVQEYGLGFTHEEVLTPILKKYISSWRDLPMALYQTQTKFRDEPRARSGVLRGKEFLMNDLYSFHADEKDFEKYYWQVADAYKKIFSRLTLDAKITEAGGGSFTSGLTHEFQVFDQSGEDEVFYCDKCELSQNKEVAKVKEGDDCGKCGGAVKKANSIEVGNIFPLGTKFSDAVGLKYKTKGGEDKSPVMGSYGIGPSRIMGTIVEIYHDDKGIIWPEETSPFRVHLLALKGGEEQSEKIYTQLSETSLPDFSKTEVLYDDREEVSAGEKFSEADLIGVPLRIVCSEKTAKNGTVEIKKRSSGKIEFIKADEIINVL